MVTNKRTKEPLWWETRKCRGGGFSKGYTRRPMGEAHAPLLLLLCQRNPRLSGENSKALPCTCRKPFLFVWESGIPLQYHCNTIAIPLPLQLSHQSQARVHKVKGETEGFLESIAPAVNPSCLFENATYHWLKSSQWGVQLHRGIQGFMGKYVSAFEIRQTQTSLILRHSKKSLHPFQDCNKMQHCQSPWCIFGPDVYGASYCAPTFPLLHPPMWPCFWSTLALFLVHITWCSVTPPPRCTLHPSLPGAGRATPWAGWQGHGPGAQIRWGSSQGAPQRVSQLSLHSIGQLCDGIRITPEVHLPFTFYDSRTGSLLFSAWKK